jgi:hypothetical protein
MRAQAEPPETRLLIAFNDRLAICLADRLEHDLPLDTCWILSLDADTSTATPDGLSSLFSLSFSLVLSE